MKRALILSKVAGIRIQVHWTFVLLILWITFAGIWGGSSTAGIVWNIIFVIVLFGCVVHNNSIKALGIDIGGTYNRNTHVHHHWVHHAHFAPLSELFASLDP